MSASVTVILWSIILSQRFVLKVSGFEISISLLVLISFVLLWLASKDISIVRKRLIFFMFVLFGVHLSVLGVSLFVSTFSVLSFGLFVAIYVLSIFAFEKDLRPVVFHHFQIIMMTLAVLGILQFLTQLIGVPYRDWLLYFFPRFITESYNYSIPLSSGNHLYKSNGFFMLEPSFFSQYLAISILIEIYHYKTYKRLFVLAPALLVSFSGTGLMLLLIGLMPFFFSHNWNKVVLLGIFLLVIALFFFSGFATYTINRVVEFQNPNSSAYQRFIAPVVSYLEFFTQEGATRSFWIGLGPGSSEEYLWVTKTYSVTPMKLFSEYGFIAGCFMFGYFVYVFFFRQPFWLALSMFFAFNLLSGALLVPQTFAVFCLLLLFHQSQLKLSGRQLLMQNTKLQKLRNAKIWKLTKT